MGGMRGIHPVEGCLCGWNKAIVVVGGNVVQVYMTILCVVAVAYIILYEEA